MIIQLSEKAQEGVNKLEDFDKVELFIHACKGDRIAGVKVQIDTYDLPYLDVRINELFEEIVNLKE